MLPPLSSPFLLMLYSPCGFLFFSVFYFPCFSDRIICSILLHSDLTRAHHDYDYSLFAGRYACVPAYRLTSGDPMIQRIDVPTGVDGGTAESEYTPPSTQYKIFGNGGGEEDDLHLDFTHPKAALELPADLIVLRWVNFHLRSAGYTKVVENLGSDLQDSEELAVVLSRCSRHCESPAVVSAKLRNVDIEARAQEIVAKCSKLGVPEHMVTVEDIVLGNADMNFALLSYLMCTAPMLQVRM